MSSTTGISWTDSTFNPWIGCTRVSEGCRHCYAETLAKRYGWVTWGAGETRKRTSPSNWTKPRSWNRSAASAGRRHRVFCASLADIFDIEAPAGARADLWTLIRETPALDWQLLTKRPQNIADMLPADWGDGWPHVWLGATTEDQPTYDLRWPVLAAVPAAVRFISYEPAIGPLDMYGWDSYPDWVIWGGESGPKARCMDPEWARAITRQCRLNDIRVFGKQWGTYESNPVVIEQFGSIQEAERLDPRSNGKGGALLDGRLWREFP